MSKLKYYFPTSLSWYNKSDSLTKSWFSKKLIGCMPLKTRARNKTLILNVFGQIRHLHKVEPVLLLAFIIHKNQPAFWIKIVKKGKREYHIPIKLTPFQRYKRSLRWLVKSFRIRKTTCLQNKLFDELLDGLNGSSIIPFWRDTLSKEVFRNRHNINYKW